MKALYITDRYGWNSGGAKRVLYEELQKRIDIDLEAREWLGVGRVDLVDSKYSHVFYASTGCGPALEEKAIKVGFGFSDPVNLLRTRRFWKEFDHYFSGDTDVVAEAVKAGIDAHHLLPVVDVSGYSKFTADHQTAPFDCVITGNLGEHSSATMRHLVMNAARSSGFSVQRVRGLSGDEFWQAVTQGRCGLNGIMAGGTLSRCIFEYAACGLCVVSNQDPRVDAILEPEVEYIPLEEIDRLHDKAYVQRVAEAGKKKVLGDHGIDQRVDQILEVLK